ncbi:NADPH--cytochrome P450 reductase [Drechslerella stenobrocha 248]|uniref:NADPH--cytochrome P450 reductase n=1 Tax=Drechslerella stenobrocha 248 TaxID=1043628 RepID=W7HYT8_9PEZI|nr:NADPH--cytochrome P450 reductase [Drechslerella stenobrocha 248]
MRGGHDYPGPRGTPRMAGVATEAKAFTMAIEYDMADIVMLSAIFAATIAYFTKGTLWGKQKDVFAEIVHANGNARAAKTRDPVKKMAETDRNAIFFYGSQTGTAEDYASRLAKEGHARFGLKTLVADIEDYDFEVLDTFPSDHLAVFVLATYGEGEPTDNAVEFYEFLSGDEPQFSEGTPAEEQPLQNLKYVTFGLGNNTYEHYNAMVRKVDGFLTKLGATRFGSAGEGDDGAGTMEEDFLAWKEEMWQVVCKEMGLEEREAVYEPIFQISEDETLTPESGNVYLGEPNSRHLQGANTGPFNSHNPYIAPISKSYELFSVKDRNCLHMEIDISGSGLSYTTGDHIAIWPTNSGKETDRLLNVLGLIDKRHTVFHVSALDSTSKVPFPSPTTYDAVIRYHVEINGLVSRQFIASLAPFAPTDSAKAELTRLGGDKDAFSEEISSRYLNIAQVLERLAPGQTWSGIPFSIIIEGLTHIQPRYYSISSSSQVQKNSVAITAVVESIRLPGSKHVLKGVTTNYLLALKQKQHGDPNPDPHGLTYDICGPRNKYDGIHVPVHIRHSNFKLPSNPEKPIIMIGPGSGVAPFRGFVQERAAQAAAGQKVGRTLLFFGCRNSEEDFLYKDEWPEFAEKLGDSFKLITAFSREGPKKVYVQHRLQENADEVDELLKAGAYIYVCGDAAHMARDVNATFSRIISEKRGLTEAQGEESVKRMRSSNKYQEDVWS